MSKWQRKTIKLDKPLKIKTRPGNNAFIANRGDVYFEIPRTWIVKPGDQSICFHDKEPPDDDCTLEMSIRHLDLQIDWTRVPLGQVLVETVSQDRGAYRPEVHRIVRGNLEMAWIEDPFVDPMQNRQAISRCLLARAFDVLPFFTFSF